MSAVPFVDLPRQFKEHEEELVAIFRKVGLSGAYIMGPELERFEAEAAKACGTKYALGVADGTDALILGLMALGVGPGDEVITVPNSFIASAGAIAAVGAMPVFVDVKSDLNMDPEKIAQVVTPRTKAIMPVHLTGKPSEMDKICQIAEQYKLGIVEDAAQAIGASFDGKKVGSLGDIGAFSLHPLKNLHVYGDGGLITTDNEAYYNEMKILRNHGLENRDVCAKWGMNSRLDSLQAAIGTYKLGKLPEWTAKFREIASQYRDGLQDIVGVPVDGEKEFSVYHNFVIYADDRDQLMKSLAGQGIDTKIHYPVLLHLQPAAASLGYKIGDFPVAEDLATKMMSLPIYPELRQDEIDSVILAIRQFYGKN